jgi:hypothetical protein
VHCTIFSWRSGAASDFPQKKAPEARTPLHFTPNTLFVRLNDASAAWRNRGRNTKLATRPLTAAAGRHPLSEVLFSPRAAFIWNSGSRSVTWMNAAARSKFDLGLQDISKVLSAELGRRLGHAANPVGANDKTAATVRVKIARCPPLNCSIESLKLAEGHEGLIVAELEAGRDDSNMELAGEKRSKSSKRFRKFPKSSPKKPQENLTGAPFLTPEELRSFRAIGRKVRKLCREKEQAKRLSTMASKPVPPSHANISRLGSETTHGLHGIFSVFDLIMFLGEDLNVLRIEGRPQRFGWRKSDLRGKPVTDFLFLSEQAVFYRMVGKIRGGTVQTSRDALLVRNGFGNGMPCRAVLGRWMSGNTGFFCSLLSLKVPYRLERLQTQVFNASDTSLLAA